jgi:hypothetical protein
MSGIDTTQFANSILTSLADGRDKGKKAVVELIELEVKRNGFAFDKETSAWVDELAAKISKAGKKTHPLVIKGWLRQVTKYTS